MEKWKNLSSILRQEIFERENAGMNFFSDYY